MKIYALEAAKLNPKSSLSLSDILDYCASLNLQDRHRNGMRLERCTKTGNTYYLDFSKLRDAVLPGKATPTTLTTALGLASTESVSEETAAMFEESTSVFMLQFNMHGPHKAAIQAYLNLFAADAYNKKHAAPPPIPADFTLAHVLHPKTQAQFNKLTVFKKIELKVAHPPIGPANIAAGQSLSSVIDRGIAGGVETAVIKLAAGRKKKDSLTKAFIQNTIGSISALGDVDSLVVTGKEDIDSETVILDLMEQTLKGDQKVQPGSDRRLPLKDRWDALYNQYIDWQSKGLVK